MIFKDRTQAGKLLSQRLSLYHGPQVLIMGLARGGVAIASVIGKILDLPIDVLIVKKIPSPSDTELAIGALAPDGVSYVDWKFAHRLGADEAYIQDAISRLTREINDKILIYRKGLKPVAIRDKTVILVDDGAATGSSMEAAVKWIRKKHARKIVVALPVAPADFLVKIKPEADDLIILETPTDFRAVGEYYQSFPQIDDEKVIELIKQTGRL